jgi:hypothetical protein
MKVEKIFGKKFIKSVRLLIDLNYGHMRDLDFTLKSLLTKRGIVRYLSELINPETFGGLEGHLWDKLVKEADKDMLVVSNLTGTYINGVRTDVTKIFTDDPEKIFNIVKSGAHISLDEFLVKVDTKTHNSEWSIVEVDSRHHLDMYTTGGTSTYWDTRVSGYESERYYGMTHIPGLLWCYTPLYDQALNRVRQELNDYPNDGLRS